MEAVTKKQRIEYFDFLRVWATFAVIMIHVVAGAWYAEDVASWKWQIFNIYESCSRWSVPIFTMMSGALFLGGTQKTGTIVRKNVLRVVTAFLFWSTVYTLIYYGKGLLTVRQAVDEFLLGYYHLWYLYVIAGLYLAVPILRKVTESDEVTKYALVAGFILNGVIPAAAECIGLVDPVTQNTITKMAQALEFHSVSGYAIYFMLGYYLHKTEISPLWRKRIYGLGLISLAGTIILTAVFSLWQNVPVHTFFSYHAPTVFLTSMAIFVFAKYNFRFGRLPGWLVSLLKKLSRYSFGVYLVHALLFDFTQYNLGITVNSFNALISAPVISLALFVVSFLVSAIIHQIPVLRKYIV